MMTPRIVQGATCNKGIVRRNPHREDAVDETAVHESVIGEETHLVAQEDEGCGTSEQQECPSRCSATQQEEE